MRDKQIMDYSRSQRAWVAGQYLAKWFAMNPMLLLDVVRDGEYKFVKAALKTDAWGLHYADYKVVFRALQRQAARLGYNHNQTCQ